MKPLGVLVLIGHGLLAIVLLLSAVAFWPPRTGVDLGGGVRLVYAVDRNPTATGAQPVNASTEINWHVLSRAVRSRVDPAGTNDVVVRPCEDDQFEIIMSNGVAENQDVRRLIATTGELEFRILANARDHQLTISLAEEQARNADLEQRLSGVVLSKEGEPLGRWVRAAKQKIMTAELAENVLRNAATGELVDLPSRTGIRSGDRLLAYYLTENGLENVDVLVAVDDGCDVTGDSLATVAAGADEYLNPCINFRLSSDGATRFRQLTYNNRPDMDTTPPFYRHLGIILDGQLCSLPRLITTISDSGRITGSFTQTEVEFLAAVLRAGTLPVQVQTTPVSESTVDPDQTSRQVAVITLAGTLGVLAILWVVMVLRYGLIGLGAGLASLLQILTTLAVVELVRSTVTLPVVIAFAVVSLFTGVGLLFVCASAYRSEPGAAKPESLWTSMTARVVGFAVALIVLFLAGSVVYALGVFPLRALAMPVVIGSLVAILTLASCVQLPHILLFHERPMRSAHDVTG